MGFVQVSQCRQPVVVLQYIVYVIAILSRFGDAGNG